MHYGGAPLESRRVGDRGSAQISALDRALSLLEALVDLVVATLRGKGATVATGRFRTDMLVELVNDGPTTVLLEV